MKQSIVRSSKKPFAQEAKAFTPTTAYPIPTPTPPTPLAPAVTPNTALCAPNMAYSAGNEMAQLRARNAELEKLNFELSRVMISEVKELRDTLQETKGELQNARNYNGQLRGEIRELSGPKCQTTRKKDEKELEDLNTRAMQLEKELAETKSQNSQLQQLLADSKRNAESWLNYFQYSQAMLQEEHKKVENLEMQNATMRTTQFFEGPRMNQAPTPESEAQVGVQMNGQSVVNDPSGDYRQYQQSNQSDASQPAPQNETGYGTDPQL